MFRLSVVFVPLLVLACGPAQPPQPEPLPRIWDVSIESLHTSYIDSSTRWTGQRVRIGLGRDRFKVSSRFIHWHSRRDTDPPCVVFEFDNPIQALTATVEIIGTVRGKNYDGHRRATGATWYVLVTNCEVRLR